MGLTEPQSQVKHGFIDHKLALTIGDDDLYVLEVVTVAPTG